MAFEHSSLESLANAAYASLRAGDVDLALRSVRRFVDDILADPSATGLVFASIELDRICEEAGAQLVESYTPPNTVHPSAVFVISHLDATGGHAVLIDQYIRAQENLSCFVLITDIFGRLDIADIAHRYSGRAKIEATPTGTLEKKAGWLIRKLQEISPERAFWFTHHQDVIAMAAAQAPIRGRKFFVHHADHNLCLGVHSRYLEHVDIHNLGFFNCRDNLGIASQLYWPLTVQDSGVSTTTRRFADPLTSCSAGSQNKFESPYLFSYADVIPQLLATTGGQHLHLGPLTGGYLARIREGLAKLDVSADKFIHIPSVKSVWAKLLEFQVGLYISSWPLGGGLACIEAMGAGTPVVFHDSFLSRFHGGQDLAYDMAWAWRTPEQLFELLAEIKQAELLRHSTRARQHYERHYAPHLLRSALVNGVDLNPPPLKPYREEMLRRHLYYRTTYYSKLAESEGQVAELKTEVDSLKRQLRAIIASRSWRLTKPLRILGGRLRRLRLRE